MYDGYRAVRPPGPSWDRKTRYAAVGRTRGTDYDDIFVVSALFHHVSLLRIRVPDRLLEVLDGAQDKDDGVRSWGQLKIWRSPWYDFFKIDDRLAAMQLFWAMMTYLMRKDDQSAEDMSAPTSTTASSTKDIKMEYT
jgi:hypothetical protein